MTPRTRNLLIAAVALVVTGGATWMGLDRWVWKHTSALLEPLQRQLAAGGGATGDERVRAMEEQLIHLNAENVLLRTRLQEYLAIRGEGGVPPEQTVVVRTRIISRTLREGRRYCEIDTGAVDGVLKGMAVCSGWSLVGMIADVQEGRALVQQLNDSESRIPAALIDGAQVLAEGVLAGTGKRGRLLLDFVEDREGLNIVPGQRVVSAGSDGRLPHGLVLGTVLSATRSSTADHWRIDVVPLRDADAAESLLVLRFALQPPAPAGPAVTK